MSTTENGDGPIVREVRKYDASDVCTMYVCARWMVLDELNKTFL